MASGTTHLLALYALADLIASLTPGPAVLTVTSHALSGSHRGAMGAILGINVGNFLWFLLAGAGLTAMVAAMPQLFGVMRWLGIGYLLWIGVQTWRAGADMSLTRDSTSRVGVGRGLLSAAAVQLSNPKALLFFTVILPPFIDPTVPVMPQIAALAMIGIAIEGSVLGLYALLAWRLGRYATSPRAIQIISRASGGMLILAALGIATTGRLRA